MSYAADLAAHYSQIRKRLVPERRVNVAPTLVPVSQPLSQPERAVVVQLESRLAPWQKIAAEVAAAHGLALDAVLAPSKADKLVACRHEIWATIRAQVVMADGHQPSYPQIGKWFGRDPSTITHGVLKWQKAHGTPEPRGQVNAGSFRGIVP